jgi:hypothetical protein
MSPSAAFLRYLIYNLEMKRAVLEFQRNRGKRQPSGAASVDILTTIAELRSALHSIGRAIVAVEHLVTAQAGQGSWRPRNSGSPKKRANTSKPKRKGQLVALPRSPEIHYPELGTQAVEGSSSADLAVRS